MNTPEYNENTNLVLFSLKTGSLQKSHVALLSRETVFCLCFHVTLFCFRSSQIQCISPGCCQSHAEGHFDRQRWPLCGLLQRAIWSAQSSRCQAVVAVLDARESRLSLLSGGKTTRLHICQSDSDV